MHGTQIVIERADAQVELTTVRGIPKQTKKRRKISMITNYPCLIFINIGVLREHPVVKNPKDHLGAQPRTLHHPHQLLMLMMGTTLPKHHHQIILILHPTARRNGRVTKKRNLQLQVPWTNPHRIAIYSKNISPPARPSINKSDFVSDATRTAYLGKDLAHQLDALHLDQSPVPPLQT